jgi:hypothetical protein
VILRDFQFVGDRPLKGRDREFEDRTRVVCSLVARSFEKRVRPLDFRKVSVHFNHRDRKLDGVTLLNVLIKHVTVDTERILSLSGHAMGVAILGELLAALEDVFEAHRLDKGELSTARAFAIEREFRNAFIGKLKVASPDGKRIAYVVAEQGLENTRIYVQVDRRGRDKTPVASVHLANDSPDEFIFRMQFGKLAWIDDRRVQLSRSGMQDIMLDIP